MKSRLVSAAAVSALALTPVIGFAGPASAAPFKCSVNQPKTFPTPGTDTRLTIYLCVEKEGASSYSARAGVSYANGGGSINKFDKLEVHVRLERYDVVQAGLVCNFFPIVNFGVSGDNIPCGPIGDTTTSPVTADGTVIYNIDGDGLGDFRWDLTGSPSL
ncbi:hypothetical protein OG711_17485 [Streptomyces uncialis]|uniref:hypothetical protein n=1 Tax=Streptomyces uncialis TaxID=1048205 RepID=UPI002E3157EF|nr:hypothetical protein [Streptomyces uncialis]